MLTVCMAVDFTADAATGETAAEASFALPAQQPASASPTLGVITGMWSAHPGAAHSACCCVLAYMTPQSSICHEQQGLLQGADNMGINACISALPQRAGCESPATYAIIVVWAKSANFALQLHTLRFTDQCHVGNWGLHALSDCSIMCHSCSLMQDCI